MTQRVIKYRAWDGLLNMMHENIQVYGFYQPVLPDNEELAFEDFMFETGRFTVMQFTGLLDKHGKEIYHNDFIKSNGGDIMLVVWREDLASFALRKEGWMYDHYFGEAVDAGHTEVIGNIYTTPELVDPKMIER